MVYDPRLDSTVPPGRSHPAPPSPPPPRQRRDESFPWGAVFLLFGLMFATGAIAGVATADWLGWFE